MIATDSDIYQLIFYLLQESIQPFIEMFGKWIYYGIIDDRFKEFMVTEQPSTASSKANQMEGMERSEREVFDWNDRFILNRKQVSKVVNCRPLSSCCPSQIRSYPLGNT